MPYETEKDAIRNLQTYLRQLSYYDSDIKAPPIDGIYGSVTKEALKSFQRKYSLTESGLADKKTFDTLFDAYQSSLIATTPPFPLPVFPMVPNTYELSMGDKYFVVSILQLILNELRIVYDSFIPLTVNGLFDADTEANVLDFQLKNALPTTGRVDKNTWDRLVTAYTDNAYNS